MQLWRLLKSVYITNNNVVRKISLLSRMKYFTITRNGVVVMFGDFGSPVGRHLGSNPELGSFEVSKIFPELYKTNEWYFD